MSDDNSDSTTLDVQDQVQSKCSERVAALRQLLPDAVLIPIPKGEKGPKTKGWQKFNFEVMGDPRHIASLERGNIGVLLGAASGHLASIDCDTDDAAEGFLALNPQLAGTLRSRGRRGCNYWVRIRGSYPATTKIKDADGKDVGEFRATGGQTVIHGKHPCGDDYKLLIRAKPVEIRFEDVVWPENWKVPWRKDEFDTLVELEGRPFEFSEKGDRIINRHFFSRLLEVEDLITYDTGTVCFRQYGAQTGVWTVRSESQVASSLSARLKRAADELHHPLLVTQRNRTLAADVLAHMRGIAKREFKKAMHGLLHMSNGMLHLGECGKLEFAEFSPDYASTHGLAVAFDEKARFDGFLDFLRQALSEEDIDLVQKIFGLVLIARTNIVQCIVVLAGAAGGGKSILVEILEAMLGADACAELRTKHLAGRFELASFVGRSLLTGKDVPADFLSERGASRLKALTGHDMMEAEVKGCSERLKMKGDFNVLINCNSTPRIGLDGDCAAWGRRLIIVRFAHPMATPPQPGFAKRIVEREASGIINWSIRGYYRLWEDIHATGSICLSAAQRERVEDAINASDSLKYFLENRVRPRRQTTITTAELANAYRQLCYSRGWQPVGTRDFECKLEDAVIRAFGISKSHDIRRGTHNIHNGFRGIELLQEEVSHGS